MEDIKNWSEAPQEVLGLIAEHLNSIEDYIRFGAVCRSWQSVTVDQRRYNFSPKTLPWMMFPLYEKGEVDNNYSGSHEFYRLSEGVHKLYLPEAINCSCSGSPYGWLIIRGNQRMGILNPLSHVSFLLPPISMLEDFVGSDPSYCTNSTHLVILPSSSLTVPLKELFVAFVLFREDGKLAFARPTDRAWTTMKISNTSHKDILLFNNKFYIVDTEGVLWCFDITRRVGIEIALPPKDIEDECRNLYLVELLGDVHMVVKFFSYEPEPVDSCGSEDDEDDGCYYFKVFKLDFGSEKWEEVHTLGDYALFVGLNTSFSILVSDHPDCKGSVFFTDHDAEYLQSWGFYMGTFNLETKTLQLFYENGDFCWNTCPVWIMPNLSGLHRFGKL